MKKRLTALTVIISISILLISGCASTKIDENIQKNHVQAETDRTRAIALANVQIQNNITARKLSKMALKQKQLDLALKKANEPLCAISCPDGGCKFTEFKCNAPVQTQITAYQERDNSQQLMMMQPRLLERPKTHSESTSQVAKESIRPLENLLTNMANAAGLAIVATQAIKHSGGGDRTEINNIGSENQVDLGYSKTDNHAIDNSSNTATPTVVEMVKETSVTEKTEVIK